MQNRRLSGGGFCTWAGSSMAVIIWENELILHLGGVTAHGYHTTGEGEDPGNDFEFAE